MVKIVVSNFTTISGLPLEIEEYLATESYYDLSEASSDDADEPPFLDLFKRNDDSITIPRGLTSKVIELCKDNNLKYDLSFQTANELKFPFKINEKVNYTSGPYNYQDRVTTELMNYHTVRLEAPTGSGKTSMSAILFAKLGIGPILFLTHRDRLIQQFIQTIVKVLDIPEEDIGVIKAKKYVVKPITVGSLMTLGKPRFDLEQLKFAFPVVVFDEAHISSALTYRNVLMALAPRYLIGLSATPEHYASESLNRLMQGLLGPVDVIVKESEVPGRLTPKVAVRETGCVFRYSATPDSPDWFRYKQLNTLYHQISESNYRNTEIMKDTYKLVKKGFKVLIVTKLVNHARVLADMAEKLNLSYSFPYKYKEKTVEVTKHGRTTTETVQEAKVDHKKLNIDVDEINKGNINILLGTLGLFQVGFDCPALSALIFASPFSGKNSTMIRQSGGRILRHYYGKDMAIILGYQDVSQPVDVVGSWHEDSVETFQKYFGNCEYINKKN